MWTTLESPAGPVRVVAHDGAITAIEFLGTPPEQATARSSVRVAAERSAARDDGERRDDDPLLVEAVRQLTAYFASDLERFDLPLRPAGTAFQQRVWTELQSIGYGTTTSYGGSSAGSTRG